MPSNENMPRSRTLSGRRKGGKHNAEDLRDNAEVKTMDLEIERPKCTRAVVKWASIPDASACMITIKDPATLQGEWTFHVEGTETRLKVPLTLRPGHNYQVMLKAQKMRFKDGVAFYQTVRQSSTRFRAEFTKKELNELFERAVRYVSQDQPAAFDHIQYLYRNKPEEYFDYIYKKRENIMEVYLKDDNGDPASLINGKINGLFFATNLDRRTMKPPPTSNFGNKRLYIPAAAFLFDDSVRLYFADFYCNFRAHYVTLVLTFEGSDTDKFCSQFLIPVDPYKNDFLFKRLPEVFVTRRIHVEVLYTENVPIPEFITQHGAYFDMVEVSKGTSTPGGLPKNPDCKVCNLYSADTDSEDEIN